MQGELLKNLKNYKESVKILSNNWSDQLKFIPYERVAVQQHSERMKEDMCYVISNLW